MNNKIIPTYHQYIKSPVDSGPNCLASSTDQLEIGGAPTDFLLLGVINNSHEHTNILEVRREFKEIGSGFICFLTAWLLLGSGLVHAEEEPVSITGMKGGNTAQEEKVLDQSTSFAGLNFGVALALTYPFNRKQGRVKDAEVDANGYVRVTKETSREPKILLEAHYLFVSPNHAGKWYCPSYSICGHGPFVAIEPGSQGGNAISAYGLGWMLAFKKFKDQSDRSSWNIGLGYIVNTGVRVLGDGLKANEKLPAGDLLRFKEVNQPGWMWLTSFTF